MINNAFHNMRADNERPSTSGGLDSDTKKHNGTPILAHAPPPKLEYVKLPGTKGSLMIKAVETAKKNFLAILYGENGEKSNFSLEPIARPFKNIHPARFTSIA
ncbi:hypothetical protein BT96DRAFT_1004654 [Gymnopus androsaceus JB14]|uniref:Uncharacterized protein n=1 Tax=Gymnopus androsaceus JB14 TaxID=1447944 RepID=A0A6A4GRW1_9AGAR|nr:hypothetical protein BT96DRAFT_1004654 [Gymnopus androsaceus JB14]